MTILKSFSCVVLSGSLLGGCVGTDSGESAPDEPVVLEESGSAISIAASERALSAAGVSHWEIEAKRPFIYVRGYDADEKLLSDMSFEMRADKTGTVLERITQESMELGQNGVTVDGFSARNRELFAALSTDATALRALREQPSGELNEVKALVGMPCSECYGIFLYCGEWEIDPSSDWWGLYQCNHQELCGACFFSWW
jgi:hypothetical protein